MVTILAGEDDSQVRWQLSQIKANYPKEAVQVLDALEVSEGDFAAAANTPDLFCPEKLVIVENASFLSPRNKTKFTGEHAGPFAADVVFVCDKLDKRKKVVKSLLKTAKVIDCQPLDKKTQPAFVDRVLKEKKLKVDWEGKQWLLAHLGHDPLRIENELEKLSLYKTAPSLSDLQELVSVEPLDNVFAMSDALFENNGLRLLAYYRNFRAQQMEPVAIVLMLASQTRFLFQVRVLMDRGLEEQEIAHMLGANPYRVAMNRKKAAKWRAGQLMERLGQLAELDQAVKSGKLSQDECVEHFCLGLVL